MSLQGIVPSWPVGPPVLYTLASPVVVVVFCEFLDERVEFYRKYDPIRG